MYYDLINASRFTPYIGFGVGVGFTDVDYGGVFARAGDPRVITTGAGLANTDAIRQNLAGTTTSEQTKLEDTLFGYQVLFGVDYALTDAVALGIKGRWTNYDRFSDGAAGIGCAATAPICGVTAVSRSRIDSSSMISKCSASA